MASQQTFLANHPTSSRQKIHTARFAKDHNGALLSNEKDTLGRWREYFKDLFNSITITPTTEHTRSTFGGGKYYPCTRSALRCQSTEGWKAAGCDEIQPEMLKALILGVPLLTRACKVSWCSGRALEEWQTVVNIPIHKKGDKSE